MRQIDLLTGKVHFDFGQIIDRRHIGPLGNHDVDDAIEQRREMTRHIEVDARMYTGANIERGRTTKLLGQAHSIGHL